MGRVVGGVAILLAAGLLALAAWGTKPVLDHLARASGEACQATQKLVAAGSSVTTAAEATTWAAGARKELPNLEEGGKLRSGFTRYIGLVEATFSGTRPDQKAKSQVAAELDTACPGMEVRFP